MKTKIRINHFCCGCSLQTGTKVVGALSLVNMTYSLLTDDTETNFDSIHFLQIFQIIGLVIFLLSTSSDASDVGNNIVINIINECVSIIYLSLSVEGGVVSFKFIGRIISTIFLVTSIILVLVSATKNNRPMLLLPWLILQVLSIITGIVSSLYIGICLLIAVPNISGLIVMALGLGASSMNKIFTRNILGLV